MMPRVGIGYDVHRLVEKRPLILGGVLIPSILGADGHSDADVLIHAICDALLGAASLGDIGYHFPDKDPRYAGIDSTILLREVCQKLHDKGYQIGNVDATVILQKPKIADFILSIRARLADVMALALDQVSVKATTSEKLGFCGREEGVAAQAIVIIEK